MEDLPAAKLRLDEVCATGYTGRKRGEVVRTRTVVSHAHTSQWLGTFGKRGNGEYRKELAHALTVIRRYLTANGLPQTRALLRLDGLYGTGAIIADLEGFFFVSASQRLHGIGSPDRAVAAPPTSRCPLQSPGKPSGANALRLPRCPCRARGLPLPRGSSHSPGS